MSVLTRPALDDHAVDHAIARRLFDDIAAMSPDVEGVSRPAFSDIETRTLRHLEAFARSHGLAVWHDAVGNVHFSLPEERDAKRFVLVGSHVDSVPYGGNFDGLAGVISGLVCLLRATRTGERFAVPAHVLALRGEESSWFGPCYLGSKALTGTLGVTELASRHKGDGRTLAEHMEASGADMDPIRRGVPLIDPSAVKAYVELHIEQGPLLIGRNIPAAVVNGIRGNIRHREIRCIGEAGHSGAVPKPFRHDPVLAMADFLVRLDESWRAVLNRGGDLVVTSGVVATDPSRHAMARIPDSVSFSLDIRSLDAAMLDEMRAVLGTVMRQVEDAHQVRFVPDTEMRVEPALCDPALVAALEGAMQRVGQQPFTMASGAGHDAAIFAAAGIPSAMVFVRNEHGSHNPQEAMALDDFLAATDIVYAFLVEGEARLRSKEITEKGTQSMFESFVTGIEEQGRSVRAYEACASAARSQISAKPDNAAAMFLISVIAQHFADTYGDQPLTVQNADAEFARFKSVVAVLDGAIASGSEKEQVAALNRVSVQLAEMSMAE